MRDWSKRTWFISGASSGFGLAAAERILGGGGRVIATARDTSRLDRLAGAHPESVLALRLDVTKPEQVSDAVREAEGWGGVDVLFNNAGYGFLGGVEESLDEEIQAQFAVNLFGAIDLTRKLLPGLRRREEAYIVNMSSISGVRGFGGAAFYAASKFALEGLSEALADELRPFDVGVLIVEPGYFRTDFSTRSIQQTANGSPDYPHLAARRAQLAAQAGAEPGSPEKAIASILLAMGSPNPPMRLALGQDAFRVCHATLDARGKELSDWRKTTESTNLPIGASTTMKS